MLNPSKQRRRFVILRIVLIDKDYARKGENFQ